MGAEALCRGAIAVVGIEKSGAACQIIEQNWQKVAKPAQSFRVIQGNVVQQLHRLADDLSELPQESRFDCIYFDPPYAGGLYTPVLERLSDCLKSQGEAAVEYSSASWQPGPLPAGLEIVKEKRYGLTSLVFLRQVRP